MPTSRAHCFRIERLLLEKWKNPIRIGRAEYEFFRPVSESKGKSMIIVLRGYLSGLAMVKHPVVVVDG